MLIIPLLGTHGEHCLSSNLEKPILCQRLFNGTWMLIGHYKKWPVNNLQQLIMLKVEEVGQCVSFEQLTRKAYKFWTLQEETQYLKFLEQNTNLFCDEVTRRSNRVFKAMASHITTRDYNQCRSHHQKLMIKWRSLDKIIKHICKKIVRSAKNTASLVKKPSDSSELTDTNPLAQSTDTMKQQLTPETDKPPSCFCCDWRENIDEFDINSNRSEAESEQPFSSNEYYQI